MVKELEKLVIGWFGGSNSSGVFGQCEDFVSWTDTAEFQGMVSLNLLPLPLGEFALRHVLEHT